MCACPPLPPPPFLIAASPSSRLISFCSQHAAPPLCPSFYACGSDGSPAPASSACPVISSFGRIGGSGPELAAAFAVVRCPDGLKAGLRWKHTWYRQWDQPIHRRPGSRREVAWGHTPRGGSKYSSRHGPARWCGHSRVAGQRPDSEKVRKKGAGAAEKNALRQNEGCMELGMGPTPLQWRAGGEQELG